MIGPPDCPIMRRWTIYGDVGKEALLPFVRLAKSFPSIFDRKLMVHYFEPNVEDRDPHDHPRGFWTLVLRGLYYDLIPCDFCKGLGSVIDPTAISGIQYTPEDGEFPRRPRVTCWECDGDKVVLGDVMKVGSVRYRPAKHTHITQSGPKGAWTIVLMGPFERPWGFFRNARWWPFKEYEAEFGFAMRCPTDEEREGAVLKYNDKMAR